MQLRTFIIAGVVGGIGLVVYVLFSQSMNELRDAPGISVKGCEQFGEKVALLAITANDDFYLTSKGGTPRLDAEEPGNDLNKAQRASWEGGSIS